MHFNKSVLLVSGIMFYWESNFLSPPLISTPATQPFSMSSNVWTYFLFCLFCQCNGLSIFFKSKSFGLIKSEIFSIKPKKALKRSPKWDFISVGDKKVNINSCFWLWIQNTEPAAQYEKQWLPSKDEIGCWGSKEPVIKMSPPRTNLYCNILTMKQLGL